MDYFLKSAVVPIILAIFASQGFWTFLSARFSRNKGETKLLMGLAHDRIIFLGTTYIERGYVYKDEYEDLYDYLYAPYKALGGNGTGEKVMSEVKALPIRSKEGTR